MKFALVKSVSEKPPSEKSTAPSMEQFLHVSPGTTCWLYVKLKVFSDPVAVAVDVGTGAYWVKSLIVVVDGASLVAAAEEGEVGATVVIAEPAFVEAIADTVTTKTSISCRIYASPAETLVTVTLKV